MPDNGPTIPKMGMKKTTLSDALFTKTQRRVLGLLFGNPDRSYYANEIVRFARAGIGAVQRELARLASARLVTVTKVGNRKHYQANWEAPIFEELRRIAYIALVEPRGTKSAGPAGRSAERRRKIRAGNRKGTAPVIPRDKLMETCRRLHVRRLALFGSAARGELRPESDVDLMVEFEPGRAPSLWDSPAIEEELSALFGNRRVDIVPPEVLRNPYRRKTIERDLKVLYEAR